MAHLSFSWYLTKENLITDSLWAVVMYLSGQLFLLWIAKINWELKILEKMSCNLYGRVFTFYLQSDKLRSC